MATGFDTSSGTHIRGLVSGAQVLDITSTGINSAAVGATTASTGAFTALSVSSLTATNQVLIGGNTGGGDPIQQVAGATTGYILTSTGATTAPAWNPPGTAILYSMSTTIKTTNPAGSAVGYAPIFSGAVSLVAGDQYTVSAVVYTVKFSTTNLAYGIFTSVATTPPTGTWTRTSGTGPATLTVIRVQSIGSYTTPTSPRNVLYLYVRMIGGGGGGEGSYTTLNPGTSGSFSYFGASSGSNAVFALGGQGAGGVTAAVGGAGGTTNSINGNVVLSIIGQQGKNGSYSQVSSVYISGGEGGSVGAFGEGGNGGQSLPSGFVNGVAGQAYGGGGGGAGFPQVINGYAGSGGGGGGYLEWLILPPLSATYYFTVGQGGTGGSAPTSGRAGGNGSPGIVFIAELYE